ncbi:MAG: hypothetical protein K6B43_12750 [Treponema sp.]|nr:hypothetical protein [Treponema sp.]
MDEKQMEEMRNLAMRQILVVMESYSGKKLSGIGDDDGICGREAEMRHHVFDGTFEAASAIKSGILNKDGVVRTLRALADFIEREV